MYFDLCFLQSQHQMKGLIWKLICPLDWEWCKPLGTESAFSINGVNIPLLEKHFHFIIIRILFWDFLEILDKLVTCFNTLCFDCQVRFRSLDFWSYLSCLLQHLFLGMKTKSMLFLIMYGIMHGYIHTAINLDDIWMKLWNNLTNLDQIIA